MVTTVYFRLLQGLLGVTSVYLRVLQVNTGTLILQQKNNKNNKNKNKLQVTTGYYRLLQVTTCY